jgi:hypothetical protein
MRTVLALVALVAVSACGWTDRITRNAPVDVTLPVPQVPAFALAALEVDVPLRLEVSESPMLYPFADIVWRGDPWGDRLAQVRALFEEAGAAARATEGRPVDVGIEVVRFHGLTQRARYATGGMYSIHFKMTLRDPETGLPLGEPKLVNATLEQFGAYHATFYDANGITERQVVVSHLMRVLRAELGQPALPDGLEID